MTISAAERQRAYRERQKIKMAEDPEYVAQVKARKAESDHKYYVNADKELLNKKANERYHKKMATDPEYRQRKVAEAMKYHWANREKVLSYKKAYREQNQDKIVAYMVQWELNNRDKRYAITAKRKFQIAATSVEPIDRNLVWERDQGICGICKEFVKGKWQMDHIIPLSLGGAHLYSNVQVSHPRCNILKSNKIITGGD